MAKRSWGPSGILPVLLAVSGCGSQASPEYRGDALLTLTGSVHLQEGSSNDRLLPTLAFEGPYGRWRVVETDVEGEFPASFTLRVFEPPPDEMMLDLRELGLDEPRLATAYITAARPDHETRFAIPNNVSIYADCAGLGPCTRVRRDACSIDAERSENHDGFDPSYCYAEIRDCGYEIDYDELEVSARECEVVETLGVEALAVRPEERFAGFAQRHRVVYFEGDVSADSFTARLLGLPGGASRGYHVLEEHTRSDAEVAEAQMCLEAAQALGVERYLTAHPELDCERVPETDESGSYIECADPDTELDFAADVVQAQSELDCPPFGDRTFHPVDTAAEPLDIDVGDEQPDFGFGAP